MFALRPGWVIWTVTAFVGLFGAGALVWIGRDYYLLPRVDRLWDGLHDVLSPSGTIGHTLGIVGTVLMLMNLVYLLRRRWAGAAGWGPLQTWLDFHVATGVAGVAIVLVHSAFLFNNPIARITIICAVVVLVTGGVGRWVYGYVPYGPGEHEPDEALQGRGRRKRVMGLWRVVHRISTFVLLVTLVAHVVTVLYFIGF